jgi:hypothetical protein
MQVEKREKGGTTMRERVKRLKEKEEKPQDQK